MTVRFLHRHRNDASRRVTIGYFRVPTADVAPLNDHPDPLAAVWYFVSHKILPILFARRYELGDINDEIPP